MSRKQGSSMTDYLAMFQSLIKLFSDYGPKASGQSVMKLQLNDTDGGGGPLMP